MGFTRESQPATLKLADHQSKNKRTELHSDQEKTIMVNPP